MRGSVSEAENQQLFALVRMALMGGDDVYSISHSISLIILIIYNAINLGCYEVGQLSMIWPENYYKLVTYRRQTTVVSEIAQRNVEPNVKTF